MLYTIGGGEVRGDCCHAELSLTRLCGHNGENQEPLAMACEIIINGE